MTITHKNVKNVALSRSYKGRLFIVRAETRRQSAILFGLGWERVCGVTPLSVMSTDDSKSSVSIDLGVMQKF